MKTISIPHTNKCKYSVTDFDGNKVESFVLHVDQAAIERLRANKDFVSCSLKGLLKTSNTQVLSEVVYSADLEYPDSDSIIYWAEYGKEFETVGLLSFDSIACDFQHVLTLSK